MKRIWTVLTIATLASACWMGCAETRTEPLSEEEIWGPDDVEAPDGVFVDYRERTSAANYGLPRNGNASIADLIALFPETALGFDDSDTFVAPGFFEGSAGANCRGGAPVVLTELPMEIEAVVTIYPRQYMKVPVCGQDERHYGSFSLEDDTGGIVVLRDSRVTPWTFGDRVKVKVNAMMLTFGRDLDTRAILVADIEGAEQMMEDGKIAKPIFYKRQVGPFGPADATETRQIDGYVYIQPTNDNFNSMVMGSELVDANANERTFEGETLQCVRSCEVTCLRNVCDNGDFCGDTCAETCLRQGGTSVEPEELPVCWIVGIDAELGRRGFSPEVGQHLQLRGPVVNNFDRGMWLLSMGQVEFLD